jgi:hypothetical protein
MNLTGGIAWHWLAWRSQARWANTSQAIAHWLLNQAQVFKPEGVTGQPSLLLIGASAGWMMSSKWLQQFARVDTFDIDPLAAHLFKWRHGAALKAHGVALHCHTQDALYDLPALLNAHPKACVFFDNVLGQVRFQRPATAWQQVEKDIDLIRKQLSGREWGSVHDRMSGPTVDLIQSHEALPLRKSEWNDQQWLTQLNAQSPWLDHLTHGVFAAGNGSQIKGVQVQDFAWNFSPRYRHWLQAGWVRP